MADLSQMSDAELMGLYQAQGQPRGIRNNNPLNLEATVQWDGMKGSDGRFAVFDNMADGLAAADRNLQTYATKHGINTVDGVVNRWAPPQENDSRAYAQTVASNLGVEPQAPIDLLDPEVRGELVRAMSEVENGQPLPAQPAATDLTQMSNEELLALHGGAPKAAPKRPAPTPPQLARPTVAQDAASGFMAPFEALGRGVMENYRRTTAEAKAGPPKSLRELGERTTDDLTGTVRMVGDVLGLASAPIQAIVRPTARAINSLPIRPYTQDSPTSAPRAMQGEEAQAAIEGGLNAALSGLRAGGPRPVAPKSAPMSLETLKAASDAAWAKVDASGFRFNKVDVEAVAKDIADTVRAEGGKALYPAADAIAKRVTALADKADLTVAQLNRLKSQVGEKLMQPGSTEAHLGGAIRDKLEALLANADEPALKEAREIYTRLKKVEEVSNRLDSADLTASSTYAGGNKANATRQKLRPLIDKKSPQRMRNLTPAEEKALKRVVKGTPTQNAVRVAGKVFDPRGLLGATVQTVLGLPTGGASALSMIPGMAASEVSNALTTRAVKGLLDLISTGGRAPAPAPAVAAPPVRLGSPKGLLGAGVTASRLPRTPPPEERAKSKKPTVRSGR